MIVLGMISGICFIFYFDHLNPIQSIVTSLLVLILGFSFWSLGKVTGFNAFGAGDVKLLTVLPLFLSPFEFIILFSLSILALILTNLKKDTFKNVLRGLTDIGDLIVFGIPLNIEYNKVNNTRVSYAPSVFLTYLLCIAIIF